MKPQSTRLLLALLLAGTPLPCLTHGHASPAPALPIPAADQILKSLKPAHPRLLLSAPDGAALKARVAAEPVLKQWAADLRQHADRILRDPPSQYVIPDGKRLLAVSRQVMNRTYTLALLHRLEGDPRYRDRLWRELDAAARFKDWNPSHFLDTAEMTHAFAIGYDWLYSEWTADQRAALRAAIVGKGLNEAVKVYEGNRWWARSRHNWNQVCNGGIGMGALALADVEPQLAGRILSDGLKSIQLAMAEYGPDGAWAEGPGYWNYATSYNVVILAALQTALGTDFGLPNIPGFADAGMFPLYITGPIGRTFNYADGGDGTIRAPSLFWLARQFQRPAYAAYQQRVASPHALDLVWYEPAGTAPPLPLDRYFRAAEVVTFRSAWDDPQAVFVGFKAGDNKANHSNLDLGTFVLDALGHRWALDLGADNYNLPGYFGNQRWTYYRMRAESHNTLVLNPGAGPDQNPAAAGKIVKFAATPERAFAIADLTAAYACHATKVQRGIRRDGQTVLVQDEVQAGQPVDTWWFLHTPAQIRTAANGRTATLTQGDAILEVQLLSPPDARFSVMDAAPLPTSPNPDRQRQNSNVRKLAIHHEEAQDTRLVVRFVPLAAGAAGASRPSTIVPLAGW